MKQNGFSMLELAVAVAAVGVLTVSASGAYFHYLPKVQFSESIKMMESEAVNVLAANSMGLCTATGSDQTIKGKYGVLTVSGTYKKTTGQSCPAGCSLSYKFSSLDVSKDLAGKIVAADITAAGRLSKTAATNAPAKFIPATFASIPITAGDSCASLADGSLTSTAGSLTGSDTATNAARPIDPITPTDPSGDIVSEDSIIIPDDVIFANDSGYRARNTENLYNLYVQKRGKPTKALNVEFIVPEKLAVIGKDTATPAIEVGSGWPSGTKLTLTNKGIVSGRGGGGAPTPAKFRRPSMLSGENGGPGIINNTNTALTVVNYGIVSGGGGGGHSGSITIADGSWIGEPFGGGGAPFGSIYTPEVIWWLHEDDDESKRYSRWDDDTMRWIHPEWLWQHDGYYTIWPGSKHPAGLFKFHKNWAVNSAESGTGGWMGETAGARADGGRLVYGAGSENYVPHKRYPDSAVPGQAGYAYKGKVAVINKDGGQIKGLRP